MNTEDIPAEAPSEWMPEADLETVAIVGKLGEETAELSNICFRILIQGLDTFEPKTLKSNLDALEDEIADVEAMIAHTRQRLSLNSIRISDRANRKYTYKRPWFDFLKGQRR